MAKFIGGTSNTRLEWVEESTEGEAPTDPDWSSFSYSVDNYWNTEPDAQSEAIRGVGNVKPQEHFNGAETWEASFEYSLAQWIADGSGNAQDISYYFVDVNSNNELRSTLSVVSRQDFDDGGNDSAGRRTYVVGKGGHPSSITLPYETESGTPILVNAEMQFQKVRAYTLHQPSSGTTLDITNNGSNSVDVTIEDEGASTTETNTVSSGSTTTTTASFSDIDVVELSTDVDGDVVVTDGSGTTLATIPGSQNYPTGEGDLGIPALGSGSHASTIAEGDEIVFAGDTFDYNKVDEIESGELTIDLGLEDNTQTGTLERNIHMTEWDAELTLTCAGEEVTETQFQEYLQEVENSVTWTTKDGETLDLTNCQLRSPGEFAPETGSAKVMMDAVFGAEDITVSNSQ